MNEVWFSNANPVRGVCIHSWICDESGNVIQELYRDSGRDDTGRTAAIQTAQDQHQLSKAPQWADVMKEKNYDQYDANLVTKLGGLLADTTEAFQSVLRRNAELEAQLVEMRSHHSQPSGIEDNSGSSADASMRQVQVPRLNLPVGNHRRQFDISTPPAYKDNGRLYHHRPSTTDLTQVEPSRLRRPSVESGRIKRGLSSYHS